MQFFFSHFKQKVHLFEIQLVGKSYPMKICPNIFDCQNKKSWKQIWQTRLLFLNSFCHQIIGANDQNINLNFCTKFHLSLGIQIRHVLKLFLILWQLFFFGISHSVSSLNHNISSLKRITKQDLVVPQNHLECNLMLFMLFNFAQIENACLLLEF